MSSVTLRVNRPSREFGNARVRSTEGLPLHSQILAIGLHQREGSEDMTGRFELDQCRCDSIGIQQRLNSLATASLFAVSAWKARVSGTATRMGRDSGFLLARVHLVKRRAFCASELSELGPARTPSALKSA